MVDQLQRARQVLSWEKTRWKRGPGAWIRRRTPGFRAGSGFPPGGRSRENPKLKRIFDLLSDFARPILRP
jgi:hypothetical protein